MAIRLKFKSNGYILEFRATLHETGFIRHYTDLQKAKEVLKDLGYTDKLPTTVYSGGILYDFSAVKGSHQSS